MVVNSWSSLIFFQEPDSDSLIIRLGIAAFALEMIPFASIAFSFTNAVGAALWAADLEKVPN
jgi:hypothetical protein